MLTYREAKYIAHRLQSKSKRESLQAAGFSIHLANHPDFVVTEEMEAEVARLQAELVANTLQVGLIDATEIHEYLTDAIRADWCDIENDDGTFKPISEWPLIWRQMKEAGDVEVEYESVRSHDGEDKEKAGGWDEGGMVRKVKIKFASRVKLVELAMKHKGVNAFATDKIDVSLKDVTFRWREPGEIKE